MPWPIFSAPQINWNYCRVLFGAFSHVPYNLINSEEQETFSVAIFPLRNCIPSDIHSTFTIRLLKQRLRTFISLGM